MEPLRVAVIGGGINSAAGAAHRAALRLTGKYSIIDGYFSRSSEINLQSKCIWGICLPHIGDASLSDFINRICEQEIDIAVVLSPTPNHYEAITKLVNAGIDVISEKSVTLTSEECTYIKSQCEQHGKFIRVTFNYSGYPMVRELVERVRNGDVGRLLQIRCEMPQEGFARPPLIAGLKAPPQQWRLRDGRVPMICHDLGVHLHHLASLITDEHIEPHYARFTNNSRYNDIKDTADILFNAGNTIGSFWFTKSALGTRNGLKIRVYGTKGSFEWYQQDCEHLRMCDNHGYITTLDRASECIEATKPRYERMKAGHPSGFVEAFSNIYEDIYHEYCTFKGYCGNNILSLKPSPLSIDVANEGIKFFENCVDLSNQERKSMYPVFDE